MSKGYGGAQKKLHDTIIKQKDGYLGPHSPVLNVGNVQLMYFKPKDTGPFWMNETEREAKRIDQVVEVAAAKMWQFTKEELVNKLREKGITAKGKKAAI